MKLFSKLDIQLGEKSSECCHVDIENSAEDLELIDACFEESSNLTLTEKSTLYYISGYITRKENLLNSEVELTIFKNIHVLGYFEQFVFKVTVFNTFLYQ